MRGLALPHCSPIGGHADSWAALSAPTLYKPEVPTGGFTHQSEQRLQGLLPPIGTYFLTISIYWLHNKAHLGKWHNIVKQVVTSYQQVS